MKAMLLAAAALAAPGVASAQYGGGYGSGAYGGGYGGQQVCEQVAY